MTTEAGQTSAGDATTGDFESEQKRYLEGFVAGVQIARTAKSLAGAGRAARAEPIGPDAAARKAQDRVLAAGGKLSDPEKFKREEHPFDTYERLKAHAAQRRIPEAAGQFPLALLRPVLRCAEPELLHVPAAIAERHLESRPVRGTRRSRRALWWRLFARHHARQYSNPRNQGGRCRQHDRSRFRTWVSVRVAPAPTISAMSPARRPPASIRRN